MNKQTIFAAVFLVLLATGALWFSLSSEESTAGQAVAAETDGAQTASSNSDQQPASEAKSPWSVRCNKVPVPESDEKRDYCQIVQRLNEQETGKRFAEFLIGYPQDADGEARGIVILPLGVLLDPGVKMQIDSGNVYQFDYRYCTDIGCVSIVKLSDQIIEEMKKGNKAAIQFISAKGLQINLPITLQGFTKAITDLPK